MISGEETTSGEENPQPPPVDPVEPAAATASPADWPEGPAAAGGAVAGAPPAPGAAARARSSLVEVALVVLLALSIALLLKVYVAEAYEIRGRSMEPTFREDQRVMLLKVFYEIHRGDIVIFASADNPQKDLIKRVVGLPGDRVEVRHGEVYVNGEKLDEPYLNLEHVDHRMYPPKDVPPDTYYVLGDNRRDSQDSRVFDPIPASRVKGKVVLRWWPLEQIGAF